MTETPMARAWNAISNDDTVQAHEVFSEHKDLINAVIPFGSGTFLHLAASKGSVEMLKTLTSLGFEVNAKTESDGSTPLVDAAGCGMTDAVAFLLDRGAVFDASSINRNALFSAVIGRSLSSLKILLSHKFDPKVVYNAGHWRNMDLLAFSVMRGELEIANYLASLLYGPSQSQIDGAIEKARLVALDNTVPT